MAATTEPAHQRRVRSWSLSDVRFVRIARSSAGGGYQQTQITPYRPQPAVHSPTRVYAPVTPYPYPYPPVAVPRPNSGMCTASLVLGILSLVMPCSFGVLPLIAVILGHVGLAQTKDGTVGGRGMGVAGLVMGYITVVPIAILSVFLIGFMGLAAA